MDSFKNDLFEIPIELIYKGRGLVDIAKVIEVYDRATRPENSSILLQRCLEEMQSKLQEIGGRSM